MKARTILGWSLVALPFVGMTCVMISAGGIAFVMVVLGSVVAIVTPIALGLYLVNK